jgi:hypothetical protein
MGSFDFDRGVPDQSCLPNDFNGGQQMVAVASKKNGKKFKIAARPATDGTPARDAG